MIDQQEYVKVSINSLHVKLWQCKSQLNCELLNKGICQINMWHLLVLLTIHSSIVHIFTDKAYDGLMVIP